MKIPEETIKIPTDNIGTGSKSCCIGECEQCKKNQHTNMKTPVQIKLEKEFDEMFYNGDFERECLEDLCCWSDLCDLCTPVSIDKINNFLDKYAEAIREEILTEGTWHHSFSSNPHPL